MANNDRHVVKHGTDWAVQRGGVSAPESVHRKQANAETAAKATVKALGGGEVRVQDRHGRFRDSDTVAAGNDPNPPRDSNH